MHTASPVSEMDGYSRHTPMQQARCGNPSCDGVAEVQQNIPTNTSCGCVATQPTFDTASKPETLIQMLNIGTMQGLVRGVTLPWGSADNKDKGTPAVPGDGQGCVYTALMLWPKKAQRTQGGGLWCALNTIGNMLRGAVKRV